MSMNSSTPDAVSTASPLASSFRSLGRREALYDLRAASNPRREVPLLWPAPPPPLSPLSPLSPPPPPPPVRRLLPGKKRRLLLSTEGTRTSEKVREEGARVRQVAAVVGGFARLRDAGVVRV